MVHLFRRKDKAAKASPSRKGAAASVTFQKIPNETSPLVEDPLKSPQHDDKPPTLLEAAHAAPVFTMSDTVQAQLQTKYKRDVIYDEDDHLGVMFQLYGSVWPRVLPWCIAVMAVTYLFIYLRNHGIVDLTIADSTGHNFMSILVSFLVVTRVTITYNRFMEARNHLKDLFYSCRELIQYTCILTNQNTSDEAQLWRQDVAYRTIVCLRLAMAAVEHRSTGISAWDVLPDADHATVPLMLNMQDEGAKNYHPPDDVVPIMRALRHGPRSVEDENFRAPIIYAMNLREALTRPRSDAKIFAQRDWHVNETLKLLAITSQFMSAYHGLKKLAVTPFPFPLIQLNRIFLFAWCFSLPLVLIHDNDTMVETLVLVFFTTFGFMGLEYANIELDDPFGDDPNDFPSTRWAESVYEDVYIAIYKTDGYQRAMELRTRITDRIAGGSSSVAREATRSIGS
uniref:Bestrophin homolog n=1 Tax=Amphora coffeiformis TaxID=265554 RepID=A0A7S3P5P1_9STRA|mmetsp:Transcript_26388/g.49831  ORF Transcript_26388/g.49831 Transcript_26388/m.49831 type:complete len:453 (+) Transcript_26388:278-1636(+)